MSSGLLMLVERMSHLHKAQGLRLPQFYFCWCDKNTLTKGPSWNRFVVVQRCCLSQRRRGAPRAHHIHSQEQRVDAHCRCSPHISILHVQDQTQSGAARSVLDDPPSHVRTPAWYRQCPRWDFPGKSRLYQVKINHHRCPARSHTKC